MRFAYADPPYIGQAKKHYGKEATYAGEVDHSQLLISLASYHGWALSCSSPSLRILLPLVPVDARIAAWVKPFCAFKPGVNPAYAWEPVIYRTPRKREREEATVRDWTRVNGERIQYGRPEYADWVASNITLRRGLSGAKPEAFCFWMFDLLGLTDADSLDDLFPGSGAVTRALDSWRRQRRFA